jgi:transposase InsO family protein
MSKEFREPKKFKQIVAFEPKEIFQVDLADIHSLLDKGLPLARYFMVCIDVYSRFCRNVAMEDRKFLRDTLLSLFRRMGDPKQIRVDEEFAKNSAVRTAIEQRGIEYVTISPWEKNKNGIVERVIGTLKRYIVKYITKYGIPNRNPVDNLQIILDETFFMRVKKKSLNSLFILHCFQNK